MRHIGILGEECVRLLFRNEGIHEERAGRTDFSYGRQFRHAGSDDLFPCLGGITGFHFIDDRRNDIFVFQFMFEGAVTITEFAFGVGKDTFFECLHVDGIYAIDHIFRFATVGAYVLHRRCPHFTGNEAEFFHSAVLHVG